MKNCSGCSNYLLKSKETTRVSKSDKGKAFLACEKLSYIHSYIRVSYSTLGVSADGLIWKNYRPVILAESRFYRTKVPAFLFFGCLFSLALFALSCAVRARARVVSKYARYLTRFTYLMSTHIRTRLQV